VEDRLEEIKYEQFGSFLRNLLESLTLILAVFATILQIAKIVVNVLMRLSGNA
jgi:hypothetical protein